MGQNITLEVLNNPSAIEQENTIQEPDNSKSESDTEYDEDEDKDASQYSDFTPDSLIINFRDMTAYVRRFDDGAEEEQG